MSAKSVWCYLIATDWEEKKSDWREFCKLRSLVKLARNELAAKESMLMKSFGVMNSGADILEMEKIPSCVKVYLYMNNQQSFINNEMSHSFDYCKDFTDGDKACVKIECPYALRNLEYTIAKQKLNNAILQRESFWRNKLLHLK